MITFDDFAKLDLRVGKIVSAEKVEGSEKMLKLQVDFGTEKRQILSGIAKWYEPEKLVGKQIVFLINIESRNIMGMESQGMLLAAGSDKPILLKPIVKVKPGEKIR